MPPHQTHTNLLGKSLLSPRDNTETPTDVCLAWNIGLLAGVIIASTLALFIFILHLILRHHHLKALKKLELANTDLTKAQTVGLCLEALLDRAEQTTLQYIGKYGRLPQEMADEEDEEEAEYSGLNTSYVGGRPRRPVTWADGRHHWS
ncbi:uncharacterized protein CTRU02_206166 [Colletotrichum truncatum]|uniref:Uncharacterized protein n=1 Tax=Colletotrichum truncatum TaxID=5467 RepID=A0ACC3Z626_COLTU|nr:uncharacterized protein CTRU02_10416 [Colletotrichum truncatum]KAF6787153.1 hypothetical protein CTRU02_10416 [Colletotrichum truncatum]